MRPIRNVTHSFAVAIAVEPAPVAFANVLVRDSNDALATFRT